MILVTFIWARCWHWRSERSRAKAMQEAFEEVVREDPVVHAAEMHNYEIFRYMEKDRQMLGLLDEIELLLECE